MGKKKTKTTQTNKPIYSAEIGGAAKNVQDAYQQAQPGIGQVSSNLGQISQSLFDRYQAGGDPATTAASDYITRTLQGDPAQNPFLDAQIAETNDNTRRAIQTRLGTRGGIGGSAERDIVSRNLAEQELAARYSDYDRGRQVQLQAAGLAPGVAASTYLPAQLAAQFGQQGALLPIQAAGANAGSIGGLLGQYQDIKGKTTQSGIGLGELFGTGLQAASLFSDRRLKTDIRRVGATDAGVPIYTYRYLGAGPHFMGVMADEVPQALGPVVEGFATVRYEAVQ